MDDFFAMMGVPPEKLELEKPAIKTAAPAPVSIPPPMWYDTESEPIQFWEGGIRGKKFVNEKGEYKSYVDKAAKKPGNISDARDADGRFLGVYTVGSGWTFNPETSGKITADTVISPETNKKWLRQSYISFDNHLKSTYPNAYKDLTDAEKEGLYGYFHMMTGYMKPGKAAVPAKDGKAAVKAEPARQAWATQTVAPKTHGLLSKWDTKNSNRRNELIKELRNTAANPHRVNSIIRFLETGELWDYSPNEIGGKEYRLAPAKKPQEKKK